METFIPFAGFYNSMWTDAIDRSDEMEAENHTSSEGQFPNVEPEAFAEAFNACADYTTTFANIAKEYAQHFDAMMSQECAWPLRLEMVELDSPREYNFTTDRILCNVPRATIRRMRKECGMPQLRQAAADRHTSRSGFISFYSPDVSTWGSVDKWDANQCETLLIAFMETLLVDEDWESDILESMDGNGYLETVVDWDKLTAKLTPNA